MANSIGRREAVQRVAAILGGTLVGGSALWTRRLSATPRGPGLLQDSDAALLDEVGETIIPATDTPGAKAAQVGAFMLVMVNDCYEERDQRIFRDGMRDIDQRSRTGFGVGFLDATPAQRTELITAIDRECKEYMDRRRSGEPVHYFRMMKELTLLGYFTSEIGSTQALRFAPVPGRFDPCLDYSPGERSWSP
ncbi:MAG: gluconate 2-dehydrogenase subunit 3 family protein [Gemmatimonadales bacterium]